jgi:Uma2 family endonuclease
MSLQLHRRRFTVEEYHKMARSGIFAPDERVKLIRGEIIQISPIGTRHAAYVRRLNTLFSERLGGKVLVDTQNPVELDNTSEPQPDVTLLKPRQDFYESAHPQVADVFLIVEVVDSIVRGDREIKIPLYAEDNIVEVWLIDINGQCIEVYRNPTPNGYKNVQTFRQGQTLTVQAFPDLNLTVDEILGKGMGNKE